MRVELGLFPLEFTHMLPPCPVCGRRDGQARLAYPSSHADWRRLEILVCNHCGHGYVPEIGFELHAYYRTEYGRVHGRAALPGPRRLFRNIDRSTNRKVARARFHAATLASMAPELRSVCDVGSGPGFLLHYLRAPQKYAIEDDEHSLAYLTHLGAERLETLADAPAPLDLIVMSHSLEHHLQRDLASTLAQTREALAPGGLLCAEVPEWGFVQHRVPPRLGGRRGPGHEPHTIFFSDRSFRSIISAAGFTPIFYKDRRFIYDVTDGSIGAQIAATLAGPQV